MSTAPPSANKLSNSMMSGETNEKEEHPNTEKEPEHPIRLSDNDLIIVWHALGAANPNDPHSPIQSTSIIYPPKGLPNGLYKDVLRSRFRCQYKYYLIFFLFNLFLLTQLALGATMTTLGSKSSSNNTTVVGLAAANTVIAGVLALLHNSGLPERYKNDWNEFDDVVLFMRELIETGILKEGQTRDGVIRKCFEKYKRAKNTEARNKPSTYAASAPTGSSGGSGSASLKPSA